MKSVGHLTSYTVNLEVQSPLFIGSGEKVTKKEYLYIPLENRAVIFDLEKMIDFLNNRKLMKKYEIYLMDKREKNIYNFFRENNIQPKDYAQFTDYTIDMAGEKLKGDTPKELNLFIKDAQGYPYIPGSSLKGALRTAMLAYQIDVAEKDNKEKREQRAKEWKNELSGCRSAGDIKKKIPISTKKHEAAYLHRLRLPDSKVGDMVNSVMRGISISDSEPIAKEQLMLAQKIDSSVKGKINHLSLLRECLKPGTVCQFTITIDENIAKQTGWTIEKILAAIKLFKQWQEKYFFSKFAAYKPLDAKNEYLLWLGGGVGFMNKTINQVSIGIQETLEYNAEILSKLFLNGHHEKDQSIGVSPHMIKLASYQGDLYPMGQCKLEVLD